MSRKVYIEFDLKYLSKWFLFLVGMHYLSGHSVKFSLFVRRPYPSFVSRGNISPRYDMPLF